MEYYHAINGYRIVAGCVRRLIQGDRVRLHARQAWGRLYWSADCGDSWWASKGRAVNEADWSKLDIIHPPRPTLTQTETEETK